MEDRMDFEGFTPNPTGVFQMRDGRGRKPDIPFCNRKLCFVATDQQFLAQLLLELSQREDCYFVKFTTRPKDGMYLGRCFLLDAEAVGQLWAEYKVHPKLMCTVQDDDFTLGYRK